MYENDEERKFKHSDYCTFDTISTNMFDIIKIIKFVKQFMHTIENML